METATVARRRFTVEDYHRMLTAGILTEDDRVELIEGEVVEKVPIGGRHVAAVNALNRLLVSAVGDRAEVSIQNPVRLSEHGEPEPDVAVLSVLRARTLGVGASRKDRTRLLP